MKTAYLKFKPCQSNEVTEENMKNIGNNTGNTVFDYSLMTTLKCTALESDELEERSWEFDYLVVSYFIWIKEDKYMSYFRNIMNIFKNKPIIPISIGIQANELDLNFKMLKSTENILKELSEKAVLAVRGEYTADILEKHGIKNIRIVGCPSMYMGANYGRKVYRDSEWKNKQTLVNYKTLSKELNTSLDTSLLNYLIKESDVYIEQTKCYFPDELRKTVFKDFLRDYVKKRKMFFKFEDWYKFCLDNKGFSLGARFHGNVVPVLAGVPALFIYFDSRTREMTDYFDLPAIHVSQFDEDKPLDYYYDLADYSEFNKNYASKLDNFIGFCLDNNLELNSGMEKYLYRQLKNKY